MLSPVHIGTGEDVDPMSYIIQGERFYKIKFESFVSNMGDNEREKFESLLDQVNLIEIRKYVSENIDTESDSVYSTEVNPKTIIHYNAKIDDIQNQLLISPFIRTEGGAIPLIPGSSIKGAIRTAIINELANKSKLPKPKNHREENEFEAKVLGYKDAKNDPFRGIKIKDGYLPHDSTIIREVRNVSKRNGGRLQANNIQIICEVTHSFVTGRNVDFETEISFDDALFSTNFLSKKITLEQIVESCTSFYRDKMEKEHIKFYKNTESERYSTMLLDTPLDKNSFILRIGRFSGVESVTLDNYRNPKLPGNKTQWGTTRNLVEEIFPMGWVKVSIDET
jgi:CRISPR-associated protein Csm5